LEQCTGAEDLLEQVGLSKLAAMTLQRKSTLPTSVAKSTYLQQLNVSLRSGPAMELTPLLSADPIPAHQLRPLTAEELSYYDINAPLFGFMGAAFALVFSNLGAAYGTGKSGMGISALGVGKPELVMKSIVPVVMAGVLGIYGLIIAVIIANAVSGVEAGRPAYGQFSAMAHFGGGCACGLSGLAAGLAIGIVGDSLTRASAEQPKLFVGMVLILIFAEALGLYGLIVGLILASKA